MRKEERSKQGQTNNKAKQHNTPKVVTFPKKNELPRVGLEPTTLYVHVHTLPALPRSAHLCVEGCVLLRGLVEVRQGLSGAGTHILVQQTQR